MKRLFLFLFSLYFLYHSTLFAAACCGGSFATPAIISGDDKAQITSSFSFTEVLVDNVTSQGIWSRREDHQQVETLKLEGSHVFLDRWQAGLSVPVVHRRFQNKTHSGVGDLTATIGYEYLPDWNYNPYRPKGIGYLQITLPTGKSRAESEKGGLDTYGKGLWSIGLGTLLTKSWGPWDSFTNLQLHSSMDKPIDTSQIKGTLKPGIGGVFSVGAGYNLKSSRWGGTLTWVYEDPIEIASSSGTSSKGSMERYATASLSYSYLINDRWAGTLSYSDQTLIGNPVNTSLGRSVSLQIQARWAR